MKTEFEAKAIKRLNKFKQSVKVKSGEGNGKVGSRKCKKKSSSPP
jgi:hypothetical protein